ncbi:integrase/recombinase xerD homolog [Haliotis cracherodii]|uniref:integrase/recombinase xerD homolog n=1 Tax=Haliotis cracherodii TaxID=6455 RepID=UPI0039E8FF28
MQDQNVYNLRTVCMCLLAFAGFMRSAKLLNIKHGDLLFFDTHMTVFIERSKTDVYRDGDWLIIGRTGKKMCPVKCMECFLEKSGLKEETNSETYLFRNLAKTSDGYIFRAENKPMSYTRLRELFIEAFKPYVPDIKCYGLHSLRSGGATLAANRGIPDRMFKRHGRWRSESAKDGYVKDSIENRLKVSLSMGL